MKIEQGFWRRASIVGAPLAVAAALAAGSTPARAEHQESPIQQTIDECAHLDNHLFEVCGAYILNDSITSLQPYFKYANSDSIFSGLKNRFQLKYSPTARKKINAYAHVTSWPHGTNTVDGPEISIVDAKASLKCNRAVLVTREDWTVRNDSSSSPLYEETNQYHTVELQRVPDERFRLGSHVLHAWIVKDTFRSRKNIGLPKNC